MEYDLILFDLDGTISDPLKGIARSINYALIEFGYAEISEPLLAQFIGPPIDDTFSLLAGTESKEIIEQLVVKYRERFSDIGYAENHVYPGVAESLKDLYANHVPMAICTSKRADYAEKILHMFELDHLFLFVSGGDIGIHKEHQIAQMLSDGKASKDTLMIGDRYVDLKAAHANGIASAGVLWGYGSQDELLSENPAHMFELPQEWEILKRLTRQSSRSLRSG
jgi:phosphoglycolate phosphatase